MHTDFDTLDRVVRLSTGATSSELLGAGGSSEQTFGYSRSNHLLGLGGSYGTLVAARKYAANGQLLDSMLGDGAGTRRHFEYDELRRVRSVQTYRATPGLWSGAGYPPPGALPTQQLLLEDYDFAYDAAGNVERISDYRDPADWPNSAKPATRHYEYDDLYRLTRVRYESAGGSDEWQSPHAAELTGESPGPRPSPHVSFDERVKEQICRYDHLGNLTQSRDDSSGFYDRSLGNQAHGSAASGPHRLTSAGNRTLSPESGRKGDLDVLYDAAGNLVDLAVRRDGPCLPSTASCWQRFVYGWDEIGQLVRAQRWDLGASGPDERSVSSAVSSPLPGRAPDADLGYSYDSGGSRRRKSATDANGNVSHDVYVFATLELRRSWWTAAGESPADYAVTPQTEQVLLGDGQVKARVVHSATVMPSTSTGGQHVLLEFSDYLGSTSFVIDRATGELVQHSSYQAYGSADSDYRPSRWNEYREPYRFTGKEEDVEVGIAYFGKRYLSLSLQRWLSPDPLNIHGFGGGQNPYAYVAGRPTAAVDPDGREPITLTALAVSAVVGFVIGTANNAVVQFTQTGSVDWGNAVLHGGLPGAVGSVFGAVGGAIRDVLGVAIGGSLGSGASYVAAAGLTGRQVKPDEFFLSMAVGAAISIVSFGVGELLNEANNPAGASSDGSPMVGEPGPARPGAHPLSRPTDWKALMSYAKWRNSERLAAFEWLDNYNPASNAEDKEYFALIVRRGDRKYAALGVQKQLSDDPKLRNQIDGQAIYDDFEAHGPTNVTVTAAVCTHSAYGTFSAYFGDGDYGFVFDNSLPGRPIKFYLGSPQGKFSVLQLGDPSFTVVPESGRPFGCYPGTSLGSLPPRSIYHVP